MDIWSLLRLFVYLLVCLLAHRFLFIIFFTLIGLARPLNNHLSLSLSESLNLQWSLLGSFSVPK